MRKVGIIGAGKISERMHIPGFQKVRGCRVVAVADVDRRLAGEIAGRFGIKEVYRDYRDMLKKSDIDAVSVCTPNFLHCRMAVDSSKALKHVIVEKPMATSMQEVKRMVGAAKKARKVLMVEQPQRFRPAHEVAQEVIARGAIGRVVHAIGRFGHGGPEGWAPDSKWFFNEKQAFGGAMADLGVHLIDLMRFIVPTPIVEVSGMMATVTRRMKLEDLGALNLRYKGGALGQACASWNLKPGGMRIEVSGTKGMMVLDHGEVVLMVTGAQRYKTKVVKPRIRRKSRLGGPFRYFVDCCRKNSKPFIDGVEGGRSLEVLIAGFKSQKTGRAVKLPLVKL